MVSIRTTLGELDCEIPIHVFGCLDPLNSVLFYLCGADVFDSLSWLRFAFLDNIGIYLEQAALLNGDFVLSDDEVRAVNWIKNLESLKKLQSAMKKYAESFNPADLPLSVDQREALRTILWKVGISTEEVL